MTDIEIVREAGADYIPHDTECPAEYAGPQPSCTCSVSEFFAALSRIEDRLSRYEDTPQLWVLGVGGHQLEARIKELEGKDGPRTREHNILVRENRDLRARLSRYEDLEKAARALMDLDSILESDTRALRIALSALTEEEK